MYVLHVNCFGASLEGTKESAGFRKWGCSVALGRWGLTEQR
jgi:hypothetical protein